MRLSLNADQAAILEALDSMLRPYEAPPLHDAPLHVTDAALDKALAESGFLDVAADPELGTQTAALVVERLARLPIAVEAMAGAFIGPLLGDDAARPVCLVDSRHPHRPVRYLQADASVVVMEEDRVSRFMALADHVRAQPDALFGYPVAALTSLPGERDRLPVDAGQLRCRWQVGLAVECAGLLRAALDAVVAHVSERKQFGRPIATFQALRHRLAEAQVRSNGLYWLTMKAAADCNPADAAMAALHAQQAARECVYDFHQFLGAMGMTLEHPLHLWTYRLKLLSGELSGAAGQALSAADALWGPATP